MEHLLKWERVGAVVEEGLHTFSRSLHLPEGFADSFSDMVILEAVNEMLG